MVQSIKTQCCIVGGGPAGMMLGFLLARSGVKVIVLEKHIDFFRDFRGDTIHPSTLEIMYELGLLPTFLQQPHQAISKGYMSINGQITAGPDFSYLPTQAKFIAMMPQWDFLNFLAEQAKTLPSFTLHMGSQAINLIEEQGIVKGVIAEQAHETVEISADLVIGADGRSSVVRQLSNMAMIDYQSPIDVLWFRLDKPKNEALQVLARINNGHFMVTIDRGNYYQTAILIHKGGIETIKAQGLPAFRDLILAIEPLFAEVVQAIDTWDKVKLLNVQVNRLKKWYRPGLLCIGDAAHAMSPVGGVGINLAVQDAVATANLLAEKLRTGCCNVDDLAKVQKRREWPAKMTQKLQVMAHQRLFSGQENNRVFSPSPVLASIIRLFAPVLRRMMPRLIGIGFRPEHIQTQAYLKTE